MRISYISIAHNSRYRNESIAAASILAKVWRDREIAKLALVYSDYDLVRNKGYGTAKHLSAISEQGITCEHHRSFSPCIDRHS
jgi:ribonuclease HII